MPPKNPLAMAEAIATYVKDEQLVQQHGQAGRALVENRFSSTGNDQSVSGGL